MAKEGLHHCCCSVRTLQCCRLGFAGSLQGPGQTLEKWHGKESWLWPVSAL